MAEPSTLQTGINGVGTGLDLVGRILAMLDPQASARARALGGTAFAGQGAQAAGSLSGVPELAAAGRGLGAVGGLATAGAGIYDVATNPDYSRAQQVGHSGRAVSDAIMSLAIPYYGLARGVAAGGSIMEGSGSPQVRGAGRAIGHVAEPSGAKAFWDVVQGDRSPSAAFKAQGGTEGLMLDTMGPVGAILRGTGMHLPFLYHQPTTGTQFRDQLGSIFGKMGIKGADMNKYNVDLGKFSPQQIAYANKLAGQITPYSGVSNDHPGNNYVTQTAAILLNSFGRPDGSLRPLGGGQQQGQASMATTGFNPAALAGMMPQPPQRQPMPMQPQQTPNVGGFIAPTRSRFAANLGGF